MRERRPPGKILERRTAKVHDVPIKLVVRAIKGGDHDTGDYSYNAAWETGEDRGAVESYYTGDSPEDAVRKLLDAIKETRKLEWSDVLHVCVEPKGGGNHQFNDDAGLAFSWRKMQVAERDGEHYHRSGHGNRVERGALETGTQEDRWQRTREGDTFAVVPFTDENLAALEEIARVLEAMRCKLRDVLAKEPDKFLAGVASRGVALLTNNEEK